MSLLGAGVSRAICPNIPNPPISVDPLPLLLWFGNRYSMRRRIKSAIFQKKFPGRITALDTTWNLPNKIWPFKWETEYVEDKRHETASVRREVHDELGSEMVPPKLNRGVRRNWKYTL